MASEIRVNSITNRSGLSTVTFSDTGVIISGVTTISNLRTTGGALTVGTGASIFSPATNVLALGTNNAEVARFDSGNLSLNTTAVYGKLTINGNLANSFVGSGNSVTANQGAIVNYVTQNIRDSSGGSTNRVTGFYANSIDEVSSPAQTMYYARHNNYYGQINVNYDSQIYYHNTNSYHYRAYSQVESKDTWWVKPATSTDTITNTRADMYLSGNLGIGTAVPSQKLEVVGGEIKAGRVDSSFEGGQVTFARSTDNASAWYLDVYGNTSTPQLRFVDVSNASVRANIDSSGNFTVNSGNLVIGTSGKGIDFSATANSSATMTSELLADYEEGTWTPTVTFGGSSTGITYLDQSGGYIKIGSQVTIWLFVRLSNKGSSTGDSKIGGLPYTNSSATGRSEGATFAPNYWSGFNSGIIPGGYVQNNTTLIYLVNTDGSMNTGSISNTVWSNTTSIYGCATYHTF